jgi:Xaa-Pro dipeptidase
MSRAEVLRSKYPAKAHAKRVVEYLAGKGVNTNGIIYLESQQTQMQEDNDAEAHFRYVALF